VIFGFGKSRDDDDDDFEEEIEPVSFQGALNGQPANLKDNARLVKAGLMTAKNIITDALALRSEYIRFEPKGERYQVLFYVDGVPSPGAKLSKQQGMAVVQVIKLLSGLNIQERKRPQSGGVAAELEEVSYQLRVATAPTPGGERLSIKAINLKYQRKDPGIEPVTQWTGPDQWPPQFRYDHDDCRCGAFGRRLPIHDFCIGRSRTP